MKRPASKSRSIPSHKVWLFFIVLFGPVGVANAQIDDINNKIKKDKNRSKSYRSGSDGGSSYSSAGDGLASFIGEAFVYLVFTGFAEAQRAVLEEKETFPERVSLEVPISYGTDLTGPADHFRGGVRGNWGIFATDAKYFDLHRFDDRLKVLDWQVLIIRVPIRSVKFDFGIGVLALPDHDYSYANSSIGIDWRWQSRGLNISAKGEWSEHSPEFGRFRKAYTGQIEYEAFQFNKVHFNPFIQYSFQEYFEEDRFNLLSLGVVMKVF